jgi:hypothetical protein
VTEDRRLRDKLSKLADEETAAGARRLDEGDRARAILTEIDETILARRLSFRSGDGGTLVLEVANRRLLGLAEVPEKLVAPEDRAGLLAPLPPDDDDALAAVAAALRGFAASPGALTVSAAPLGRAVGSGSRGRSAAALARTLGIDLYDRPAPPLALDPGQGFAAGLARVARAMAAMEAGQPGPASGPDADAVERLGRLAAPAFGALDAELRHGAAEQARFLLLSGAGDALFLARSPTGRAIAAIVSPGHLGALLRLWQATGGA